MMADQRNCKLYSASKKIYQALNKVLNWNADTTVTDLRRLSKAHYCCLVGHVLIVMFAGVCSTTKYGSDDDDLLPEEDRQFLSVFCVITGFVGFVQSGVVTGLGMDLVKKLTLLPVEPACEACQTLRAIPPTTAAPIVTIDPLRKYRINNIVFICSTAFLVFASTNVLCGLDAWSTDFGLVLGGYMVCQTVTVGLYIRGAFSGLPPPPAVWNKTVEAPTTAAAAATEEASEEGKARLLAVVVESEPGKSQAEKCAEC